jgi:preprotein translocase subunit YajC
MGFLILLIVGFVLMWLLIVMPQRRRQAAHVGMIEGIEPGDYVVTAGGLYGTVTELGQDDLGLEIAPDVEVRVAKRAIGAVIPPDEIDEVEELGELEEGDAAEADEVGDAETPVRAESADPDRR